MKTSGQSLAHPQRKLVTIERCLTADFQRISTPRQYLDKIPDVTGNSADAQRILVHTNLWTGPVNVATYDSPPSV